MREVLIIVLFVGGVFFFAVGALGLIRLPDVFSRMHATAKSDTLGAGLILTALIVYYGFAGPSLRIVAIVLFITISAPVATHLIARAVYRAQRGNAVRPLPDAVLDERLHEDPDTGFEAEPRAGLQPDGPPGGEM